MENLVTVPVKDYADIDNRIEEGTRNRTVAATNMNATSRSVIFVQQSVKSPKVTSLEVVSPENSHIK